MNKLQTKLATAIATGAILAQSLTGAAFAASYNFNIQGNGSDSDTEIDFDVDKDTSLFQSNTSRISNDINIDSNTGDNDVNDNTGGDVEVTTGDVDAAAVVQNFANQNHAVIDLCDCEGDATIQIKGNGSDSDNDVEIDKDTTTTLVQDNFAWLHNDIDMDADTGDNDVDDNTGGSVELTTGDVTMGSLVRNFANVNTAVIGGGNGSGDSSLDINVQGNGSDSENDVDVDTDMETSLFQFNTASIWNDLEFDGDSGDNSVSDNTGSLSSDDPSVLTGDITIEALVDNFTGFNVATVDCGCVFDVTGSVLGNGSDSDNEIDLEVDDELVATQDNSDFLHTDGDVDTDTGDNDVDDNTGGENGLETGASDSTFVVGNVGGVNVFGDAEFDMGDLGELFVWPWEAD
jgi:hypothetical protein